MKLFLIVLICFFTNVLSVFSQTSELPASSAYYPFNGNPNDESGNGRNGVLFGPPTLTIDRAGQRNSAYIFDGVDDYITTNTNLIPGRFTITAWVNVASTQSNNNTLFSIGQDGPRNQITIKIQGGKIIVDNGTTDIIETETVIGYNTWAHVAITGEWLFPLSNSPTELKIYINGSLVEVLDGVQIRANGNILIGTQYNLSDFFEGSIDDFRLYRDYALSSGQVQSVYNLDAASNNGGQQVGVWSSEDGGIHYEQGKVRIGTTSAPNGYRLFVEEGILTEKIKISMKDGSQWADFVFDNDYSLPPLSQVNSFIQCNGHLPDVPSAEEMVTDGLDIMKINATLLQKIEELTLYTIEQNDQILQLMQRVEMLESH